MLNIVQQLMHFPDPEHLYDLDTSAFENPDIHIYWKDQHGKYIGSNDILARNAGFNHGAEIIGATDHDLCWSSIAEIICTNDREIIAGNQYKSMLEPFQDHNNNNYNYLSFKSQLRTKSKKVVGVMGISLHLKSNNDLDLSILSKRQRQCLYFLVRGMSVKEVARQLDLSPKTVEHYLDAVKNKFNCTSLSELRFKATTSIIF